MPYKVKYVLTLVQVVEFMTGRMALRLKTGAKAFSSASWVGSEQFTSKALDSTGHTHVKGQTHFYIFRNAERIFLRRFTWHGDHKCQQSWCENL